jgi:uncharacterized membrane protein
MGLACEILGLVIFLGAHVFVTMRGHRAALIARIGDGAYKSLFSLVSLIGIVLLAYGFAWYRNSGVIPLWYPPPWTRHIAVALMWPASIMVVAAYIRGNIARVLKHPMLIGVKTWAAAHLCANGDLGGIILFGAFLLWAGYDRVTLKRRSDPGAPPIPAGGIMNDIIAMIAGTILYLVLGAVFHPLVIGLPAFAASFPGQ